MNFKTKFWPNRSEKYDMGLWSVIALGIGSVSYTHLRAHET